MLVRLDTKRNYIQFCALLNAVSVLTNLQDKLFAEFHNSGNWIDSSRSLPQVTQHTEISSHLLSSALYRCGVQSTGLQEDYAVGDTVVHFVISGAAEDNASRCFIHECYQINRKRLKASSGAANDDLKLQETMCDILHLMPTDYEKTLHLLQDHLSDKEVCQVLSSANCTEANKIMLDCALEAATMKRNVSDLCSCLRQLMPLSSNPQQFNNAVDSLNTVALNGKLHGDEEEPLQNVATVHQSITPATDSSDVNAGTDEGIPQKLIDSKEFVQLRLHYRTILHLMPDDYELTIGKLQNYISDDQICTILFSENSTIANKILLDCLIERINHKEELLDLCDQLEKIPSSQDLKVVINKIKSGCLSPMAAIANDNPVANGKQTSQNKEILTKTELQQQMKYRQERLQKGYQYHQPPPLPSNYVCRQMLLEEMASKLCQASENDNTYGTSLTVTGAGGFGKSTLVTALCYHPIVQEVFTDGFVFVELGAQATDPCIKLSQLYHLLTGQYLKQSDANHAEQEIGRVVNASYRNLLVIIDDVWHVEDAEPIVKAFSKCKIVLTTRMNNTEQYIPTKERITIGPMEKSEAFALLTSGIINGSHLLEEDVCLLNELVEDVHLWPLLLSLIRGQLFHYLNRFKLSCHEAIHTVQHKLQDNGLIAFDKNNIEIINQSRKYAVKVCIEVTLQLLTDSLSNKLKALILFIGIGTSLTTAVLHYMWSSSKQEAKDAIDALWAYGLVQHSSTTIHPTNNMQHCVEVHAVISQYIIENMDSTQVETLSPQGIGQAVSEGLKLSFQESLGVQDLQALPVAEFLKYTLKELEYCTLPENLKQVENYLGQAKNSGSILTSITSLKNDCQRLLKGTYKLSRNLNQKVQRCLYEKSYDCLIKTVEDYCKSIPGCEVAQEAAVTFKKIMPYCSNQVLNYLTKQCEILAMLTPEYHEATALLLPIISMHVKLHKQISSSLNTGSPTAQLIYQNIMSDKFNEEFQILRSNWLFKLQEVAPGIVRSYFQ